MRRSLRSQLTFLFIVIAIIPLLFIAVVGIQQSIATQIAQVTAQQDEVARRVSLSVDAYIQNAKNALQVAIETNDTQRISTQDANLLLTNLLSFSDVYEEISLVDQFGTEKAKVSRTFTSGQQELGSLKGTTAFDQPFKTGQTYYSDVFFDPNTGQPFITISIPVIDLASGNVTGVLTSKLRFKTVWDLMSQASTGDRTVYMTSLDNYVVAHPIPSFVLQQTIFTPPTKGEIGTGLENQNAALGVAPVRLGGNTAATFYVVTELPINVALASSIRFMVTSVVVLVITILVISLFSVWQTRQLSRPIEELADSARSFAAGKLDQRVAIKARNEIGALGEAFNQMASQLQETLQGLEGRVAARTRDLEIVAEVGTATATILESERLLQEVVDLTKERFNLYHSHIYLLDEEGRNLVLTAGAGEPGRVMVSEKRSIPLDSEQSLVARAARERKGITVNDVTQAPDHLPNPLLPDTHSELAVPMMVGGNVIGVFDIQSEQVGRFTDADVNIQTTLAAQLATSIQNVRSFEQSKKQAELQSLINVIGSRIQRTTSIEETLQTAIRELGTAIGASRVKANISTGKNGNNN